MYLPGSLSHVRPMEDPVVAAAQLAFSVRIKNSSDVSENTKNAQVIAKVAQGRP
jgi:hypothetical protein